MSTFTSPSISASMGASRENPTWAHDLAELADQDHAVDAGGQRRFGLSRRAKNDAASSSAVGASPGRSSGTPWTYAYSVSRSGWVRRRLAAAHGVEHGPHRSRSGSAPRSAFDRRDELEQAVARSSGVASLRLARCLRTSHSSRCDVFGIDSALCDCAK